MLFVDVYKNEFYLKLILVCNLMGYQYIYMVI